MKTMHASVGRWLCLGLCLAWPLPRLVAGDAPATHGLWRVSRGDRHMYIQGSVHLLKPSAYPLPPPVEAAFAEAEVLVLEADLSALQRPAEQMRLLQRGMFTDGSTLSRVLSAETLAAAEARLGDLGLNMAMFEAFKPWFFAMTVTVVAMNQLGFNAADGLDWHYHRRAMERDMPVVALETLDGQLAILDAIDAIDQDALVRKTFADLDTLERDLDRVAAAWAAGRLDEIEATLLANLGDFPEVKRRLLTDRNLAWIPKIDALLDDGRVHMVVVGVGHLPGPHGVLALLEARGCRIAHL